MYGVRYPDADTLHTQKIQKRKWNKNFPYTYITPTS